MTEQLFSSNSQRGVCTISRRLDEILVVSLVETFLLEKKLAENRYSLSKARQEQLDIWQTPWILGLGLLPALTR